MHFSKALLRGGGGGATGVAETSEICRRRRQRCSNAVRGVGGSSLPCRPPAASPSAPARSLGRAEVSTRASPSKALASSSVSAQGVSSQRLRFRRRASSHGSLKPSSSSPSTSLSAASSASTSLLVNGGGGLSPAKQKPAALRASDSDDPSDDDDPASELTAEELAMALSDDVPPSSAFEDDEDDEDDEEEFFEDDAAAAAAVVATAAKVNKENSEEEEDDARALAVELARVASGVKASDVVVLHVAPLVYWTSYMVLCTVFSRPQLGAVLAKAEEAAAGGRFGRDLGGVRGAGRSPWEVLDFGDVVMHCFTPDQREFYDLEGFYGAAEEVELPFEGGGGGGGGGGLGGAGSGKRDASSWARRG